MKYLLLTLTLLTIGCGKKSDDTYRTYRSGDKAIVYRTDEFKINDPFPIQFFTADGAGTCTFWLSGMHNDNFNRSIEHYSISNCTDSVKSEGGTYQFDGVGFTLCENETQCRTYRR